MKRPLRSLSRGLSQVPSTNTPPAARLPPMPSTRRNDFLQLLVIAVIAAILSTLAVRFIPFVRLMENWVYDLRVATLTPSTPQSKEIVIVTVTEDTLATLSYRSPLDRRFLSNLLRDLEKKAPRAIGLDILLDQPTEPDKDQELRSVIRGLKVPTVVAWVGDEASLSERQLSFMKEYLESIERALPYVANDSIDGTVRSFYISQHHGETHMPGLAAALARIAGARVADETIVSLAYRGSPDNGASPFPVYPAHSVALLPNAWFSGKIVLIGADLPLEDRHRTPFAATRGSKAGTLPGVTIHAHALAQLLENRSPRGLTQWQQALLVALFAAAGMLVTLLNLPAGVKALVGVSVVTLAWAGGFLLYQQGGPLLPLVAPTIAFGVTAGVASAHLWRREQRRRRFIRYAFSKYLAPDIIAQLEADPTRLSLTGEKREATFVFTDIAGFTALTETTAPNVLVPLLNAYFDGTCEIVLRYGGTIDKFVGDALHIMFNAPGDQPDHAERAVRCAMELDAFCQAFCANRAADSIAFGETRLGVNTGMAIVGNFGGHDHFDYTAHGDSVNTAARLEGVNKHLGTRVCVSATTAARCKNIAFRPVGRLVLKGKTKAIQVWQPLSAAEAVDSKTVEYLEAYRRMENEDSQAASAFVELAQKYPDDGLIAFHSQRLAAGETGSAIVMREK